MNDLDDARSVSSSDDPEYDIHADDFFKDNIEFLLNSNNPRDKEVLNLMIINAAQTNDAGLYIQLLNKNYKLHTLNDKGQTAMHIAFYHNSDDVNQYAIEDDLNYQDVHVNYSDCNGLTHLHIVCDYGTEESDKLAKKYLDSGANVDACFEVDPKGLRSGFTPLHLCVTSDHSKDSFELLLKYGANVMARDKMGRTPLHLLCSVYGSYDVSECLKWMAMLLERGSDVNAKDNEGNTPLHSVFVVGRENEFSYYFSDKKMSQKYKLLRDHHADVTVINNDGNTILHCVIMNLKYSRCHGNLPDFYDRLYVEIIDEIFSSNEGIDVNAKNKAGETFLEIAVSMLSVDIVSNLIKREAQVTNLTLIRNGRYCFYETNFLPNLETVMNAITVIDLLLENGFEFSVIDQLAFMRFLLQDNRKLSWTNILEGRNIEAYLDNLLNFGTFTQVQRVYMQMALTLLGKKQTHMKNKMYKYAKQWFRCRRGLFYDDFVIDFLGLNHISFEIGEIERNFSSRPKLLKGMKDEYMIMKTTFVKDNINVLSVLQEHPNDIYQRIKDVNLQKFTNKFTIYKSVVEGHFTKCLIRNCLEKMVTNDYLKKLVFPALPDICCRMIYFHLDNEDIVNVFSLAICENQ